MKNRLFIIIVIIIMALLLLWCVKKALTPRITASSVQLSEYAKGRELFARIDSPEAAEDLAKLYGIELVDYSDGIAVFHTEENPVDVMNRGKNNGWPAISINHIQHIDN